MTDDRFLVVMAVGAILLFAFGNLIGYVVEEHGYDRAMTAVEKMLDERIEELSQ